MEFIEQLIWVLGGWTVVLSGIFIFLGKNLTNKLSSKWERNNQRYIEILKGEISKNEALTSNLINASSSGYQASQEKRIAAIEDTWNKVLTIKEKLSTIYYIYSILTEVEIQSIYTMEGKEGENMRDHLSKININSLNILPSFSSSIEKSRPFIGDSIWGIFNLYITFVGRSTYLLIKNKDDKTITLWKDEKILIDSLEEYLSQEEIEFILNKKFGSFNSVAGLIEQKLINEINKLLSGDLIIENGLEQLKKLEKLKEIK